MTPRRSFDDRTADALLSGREVEGEEALGGLLAELSALPAAPAPNAALAALLADGFTPDVLPLPAPPRARRSWALPLQVALGTSACLALVLGAAAAGDLPGPAQTAVADVVEAVTPLHVPRPAPQHVPQPVPQPVPAVVPSPTRTAQPARQTPEPGDDRRGSTPRPSASADDHRGPGGGDGGHDGGHDGGITPRPAASRSDDTGSGDSGSGDSGSGASGSGERSSDGSGSGSTGGTSGSGSDGGAGGSSQSGSRDGGGATSHGGSSDDSNLTDGGSDH